MFATEDKNEGGGVNKNYDFLKAAQKI